MPDIRDIPPRGVEELDYREDVTDIAWVMNAFDTLKFLSGFTPITPAFVTQSQAKRRLREVLRRTKELFGPQEYIDIQNLFYQEDYFGALGYLSAILEKRAHNLPPR